MEATKYKMTINKNGVIMNMNARKGQNGSTMFYLKGKSFILEGLSHKEANRNLLAEGEVLDDKYDKENWRKKMGLPHTLDITVAHRYSHLIEKLLHLTYDALWFQLDGTLEVCDGFARSKARSCSVRNKTHTQVANPVEKILWT